MRILHTSDLHIGKFLDTYDLKEDTMYVLNQVIEIAKKENIETVLISGDVFDRSNPSEDALSIYTSFLKKLLENGKRKVIAIAGNHDSGIRLAAYKDLFDEKSGYFVEGVYGENSTDPRIRKVTLSDEYGPINFYLLPFFRSFDIRTLLGIKETIIDDDAMKEIMKRESIDTKERNIILSHQFVAGYEFGGSEQNASFFSEVGGTSNISLENFDCFDYVALGHIHKPQRLGRDTIRYSGSLLNYKKSEISEKTNIGKEKSVVILDFKEKDNIDLKTVTIDPLHPLVRISGYFEDLKKETSHKEDYVYLNILDTKIPTEARNQLSPYYHKIIGMEFPNCVMDSVLSKQIEGSEESPMDFISSYYKERTGNDLSDEDRELLMEIYESTGKKEDQQ